jgi:hypothetical protein
VGISNIDDPFSPERNKKRIDFIFARQERAKSFPIADSRVLFNPESTTNPNPPGVSDRLYPTYPIATTPYHNIHVYYWLSLSSWHPKIEKYFYSI